MLTEESQRDSQDAGRSVKRSGKAEGQISPDLDQRLFDLSPESLGYPG